MNVTLDKKDDVNGIISIELNKQDYQEKVDKSMKQLRNKVNIPGFRQGKVPVGVIKKMYGKSVLVEEINKLVSESLYNYIHENKIQILGEPLPQYGEENKIDFDKEEAFTFKFDVALTPEFDLAFSQEDEMICYNVGLEENLLEEQMNSYRQTYGNYESVDDEAKETDMLKGTLTELDEEKENRIVLEDAVLMASYIKDEEEKKKFEGVKKDDAVTFNPAKAYDNSVAELSSFMQISKEEVPYHNGDFSFEIKDVTRYKEAEMNQELFDKVLGEGVVTSEEEFTKQVKASLEEQFIPSRDYLFSLDARALILEKMKDIKFPDEFLKRWLKESNKEKTEEELEKEYPNIIDDLKYHLQKEKIVKAQEIKVEHEEVKALAMKVARAQFAQYGMNSIPEKVLHNYVNEMLEKEESVRGLVDRIIENKVMEWIKSQVKLEEKSILSKEFSSLFDERTAKDDNQAHTDSSQQADTTQDSEQPTSQEEETASDEPQNETTV